MRGSGASAQVIGHGRLVAGLPTGTGVISDLFTYTSARPDIDTTIDNDLVVTALNASGSAYITLDQLVVDIA